MFAHNYVPLQARKLKINMKTKEILMLCASALLVMACGDDDAKEGNDGSGNSGYSSTFTPQELVVKGNVEKGPFISGSTITMQPLNKKMQATGSTYTATITDNYGSFTFNPEKFDEPYARLSVNGYFYNEYKGNLSKGQITLQSVVDLKDKSSVNVNLLTHLKYQRVMNLIEDGKDYTAANKQAQEELLKCFCLQSLNTNDVSQFSIAAGTDESAALIVTSALLLGKRSEAEFTEYLAKLCADFAEDGEFSEDHQQKMQEERMALYTKLDTIRTNLIKRYEELGSQIKVKPLKNYIDWDNDGILGNESHDPDKPITLSKSEIHAPMEGGTYEVIITSDVPLYLEPQFNSGSGGNTWPSEYGFYGPMTGGYITTEKSIKNNLLTITFKEAEWQTINDAYIPLYDYMGNNVAKVNISQTGNPEGKWLNDNGISAFNIIGNSLITKYFNYNVRQLYESAQYRLSNDDKSKYHLDDVMRTYALLICTWGSQTRSSYHTYYWNGFIPLDQAIADLQAAIENLEERSAGDCQTPEDVAKSSKDVARYVLAYCYMCMNEQQLAQQLLDEILNSGRCNQSTPVLRIGNNSVIGYSDVVRLMNGEGNDDYNIEW